MKVICINGIDKHGIPIIPEGATVTATQCPVYPDAYDIAEYPYNSNGVITAWGKRRFIPLSQIDEMELLEQRQTELV